MSDSCIVEKKRMTWRCDDTARVALRVPSSASRQRWRSLTKRSIFTLIASVGRCASASSPASKPRWSSPSAASVAARCRASSARARASSSPAGARASSPRSVREASAIAVSPRSRCVSCSARPASSTRLVALARSTAMPHVRFSTLCCDASITADASTSTLVATHRSISGRPQRGSFLNASLSVAGETQLHQGALCFAATGDAGNSCCAADAVGLAALLHQSSLGGVGGGEAATSSTGAAGAMPTSSGSSSGAGGGGGCSATTAAPAAVSAASVATGGGFAGAFFGIFLLILRRVAAATLDSAAAGADARARARRHMNALAHCAPPLAHDLAHDAHAPRSAVASASGSVLQQDRQALA